MQGGCVGPRMQYTNKSFPAIYTVSHANALPRASKRCLPVLTRMLYIRRGGEKKKSRGEGRANVLKNGTKKKKTFTSETHVTATIVRSHNFPLAGEIKMCRELVGWAVISSQACCGINALLDAVLHKCQQQ